MEACTFGHQCLRCMYHSCSIPDAFGIADAANMLTCIHPFLQALDCSLSCSGYKSLCNTCLYVVLLTNVTLLWCIRWLQYSLYTWDGCAAWVVGIWQLLHPAWAVYPLEAWCLVPSCTHHAMHIGLHKFWWHSNVCWVGIKLLLQTKQQQRILPTEIPSQQLPRQTQKLTQPLLWMTHWLSQTNRQIWVRHGGNDSMRQVMIQYFCGVMSCVVWLS